MAAPAKARKAANKVEEVVDLDAYRDQAKRALLSMSVWEVIKAKTSDPDPWAVEQDDISDVEPVRRDEGVRFARGT